MIKVETKKLEELEKNIGYTFNNKKLLQNALTHTSYAYEHGIQSNEKLEFLGDSILEFVSSEYMYNKYLNLKEGQLTKVRATVVCEKSLYKVATAHNFGKFLYLGKSEIKSGGNKRPAILADSVEAVIAAIFIDGGLEPARKFIIENLKEEIEIATKHVGEKDYKTVLQEELQKNGDVKISLDAAINWGRSNSLWSLTFGTSCCGIEFMAVGCARYDFSRFGFEVTRNSPRQADLIMCAGTITNKMAPVFKRLYDEMAEPKYVVAVGGCAISGGPFKKSYNVVRGISELVPVDVYIPGCPPRPEAILYGMMQLQRKVKVEKFFGGANHKMTQDEKELSMSKGGLRGLSNENLSDSEKLGHKEPIIVTEVPEDFDPQKGLTD